jgi:GTP cyclohydrolase I
LKGEKLSKPSKIEAENAIRILLEYIGDNSLREGLVDTPQRVVESYEEFFKGYRQDPNEILSRTFEDIKGYDEIVLLKNLRLESYCEHHMLPIIGKAHIAYLPDGKIIGISKIARTLDVYAKRLQTQERLTAQVALAIEKALNPKGVAVIIDSDHHCMTNRGVRQSNTSVVTTCMYGVFRTNSNSRSELMTLINQ